MQFDTKQLILSAIIGISLAVGLITLTDWAFRTLELTNQNTCVCTRSK